jgi:hypothetical protein
MINKLIKIFLIMVAIFAGTFGVVFTVTQEVPVLNKSVEAGYVIKASDIATVRKIKTDIPNNVFTNALEMIGKEANIDLEANTLIKTVLLSERKEEQTTVINDNRVTIPIQVDSFKVPSDLAVGAKVNILIYFDKTASASDQEFSFCFADPVYVSSITKDTEGKIIKVDVTANKATSTEIVIASSLGDVFMITNLGNNNNCAAGATPTTLYSKYMTQATSSATSSSASSTTSTTNPTSSDSGTGVEG